MYQGKYMKNSWKSNYSLYTLKSNEQISEKVWTLPLNSKIENTKSSNVRVLSFRFNAFFVFYLNKLSLFEVAIESGRWPKSVEIKSKFYPFMVCYIIGQVCATSILKCNHFLFCFRKIRDTNWEFPYVCWHLLEM